MGREDLCVTVPSLFRCPISLDVMKSPVSLSTGVTYDRSSIQHWLDCGHDTCPATMQVLRTKDLIPNRSLNRLIQIWSDSLRRRRPPPAAAPLSHDRLLPAVRAVSETSDTSLKTLRSIASSAYESGDKLKAIAGHSGFVPALIDILADGEDGGVAREVVGLLDLIVKEYDDKAGLMRLILKGDRDCHSSMLRVFRRGAPESRIVCAKILESIAVDADSKLKIAEKEELLSVLLLQIESPDAGAAVTEAALDCLIALSPSRRVKSRIAALGGVKAAAGLLGVSNLGAASAEKALKLLEMVSSCREGRSEVCGDPGCVAAVVGRVLKTSGAATKHAVTILWSVCYALPDPRAQRAVESNNGLAKILLVLQSNCSPEVRLMAADMLKTFRGRSKACISSYVTETTHIMPF